MAEAAQASTLRLRGVRHNNLKNFDLDLPLRRLIVVTGLSGSGKSSLAFDTLFAEGQRRYIETFSPYARQFFDRMDKPQVDSIEGIPPAIAIEQRNAVRTTRSTVGTMTEICDYLKLLWPHLAPLHCRGCGRPVRKDPPQRIWQTLRDDPAIAGAEVLLTFDLAVSARLTLTESLALVAKQGYQRLLLDGAVVRLEDVASRLPASGPAASRLTIVQDRVRLVEANRARFVEACEQAYHFGKGRLAVFPAAPPAAEARRFSNRLHCAACDLEYREPSPALFSFNHPVGACPACKGFGRIIGIDYHRAIPDRTKSLAQGAIKPWQSGVSAECQQDLAKFCRASDVPMDVPFHRLSAEHQRWVIEGDPDYGSDPEHEWPRAWYGVKGYFRWLESKAYKMHVRVLLSRYRSYRTCPECQGQRLQPEALLYRLPHPDRSFPRGAARPGTASASGLTLADFYALPIHDALALVDELAGRIGLKPGDPLGIPLQEIRTRLGYLVEVGLGYLTLERPTRTLSGGETERVNLTTCLGTRLVNTLFVLDEPSVGLHARDTERLIRILERLRDTGNTVVVVEHEAAVIRAADHVVDLGPGHGESGGQVVFQGTGRQLLRAAKSLTGQYLSGRKRIETPTRRPVVPPITGAGRALGRVAPSLERDGSGDATGRLGRRAMTLRAPAGIAEQASDELVLRDAILPPSGAKADLPSAVAPGRAAPRRSGKAVPAHWLSLAHATCHNLRDLTVAIPLGRLVCVTGVSGSGKTTLVKEVLLPALTRRLNSPPTDLKASDRTDAEATDDPETDRGAAAIDLLELEGAEHLQRTLLVDQSPLGKTPRSNPAVYIGAFDDIREVFAQSETAQQQGLAASAFSFNSAQGQCERCRGAGFEKIEMQFLSDVFIRCPDCNGRRYRAHILDVTVPDPRPALDVSGAQSARRRAAAGPAAKAGSRSKRRQLDPQPPGGRPTAMRPALSIADLLEATVDEAIGFLEAIAGSTPARRAAAALRLLQEVGLGYLRLGQPINTLSGGESQRLKLVSHLTEFGVADLAPDETGSVAANLPAAPADAEPPLSALFLFDEPTTGLHFEDVRVLLRVFQRFVNAGHSVVVIEHNLDVIRSADWVIDLGPEAGDAGGRLVVAGTPEEVAACAASHTGQALRRAGLIPPTHEEI